MALVEGRVTIDDVAEFVDRLEQIGTAHACAVQAFDARRLAGRKHLQTAVDQAVRAIDRGENIAEDHAVEILLYAAGRRQIDQALDLGLSSDTEAIVVVIVGDGESGAAAAVRDLLDSTAVLGVERDESFLMDFFDITEAERGATGATLEQLVIERVVLLTIDK